MSEFTVAETAEGRRLAEDARRVASPFARAREQSDRLNDAPPRSADALRNPLTNYPKPPFKRQRDEASSLASKMDRRPDYGETS